MNIAYEEYLLNLEIKGHELKSSIKHRISN